MIGHRQLCRLVDNNWFVDITPDDVIAQSSTFSFDAYSFDCWTALANGAATAVVQPNELLDPALLRAAIDRDGITTIFLTSALFNRHVLARPDIFAGMKSVLYGGEGVDRGPAEALLAGVGAPANLTHVYGPTETTVFATRRRLGPCDIDSSEPLMPIGAPLANTQAYVLDGRGRLAPLGVAGELWIGGPGVGLGYWNRPELTAQRFVPHPLGGAGRVYRSGDLVR